MSKPTTTPTKRGGGRPSALSDPAKRQRIIDLIRAGNFPEVAGAACGVPKVTLMKLLVEGGRIVERVKNPSDIARLSKNRRIVAEFARDVSIALAESEARDVMLIGKHADKDWRAAAFRLSNRSKDRWGESLQVSGVIGSVTTNEPPAQDWVKAKIAALMAEKKNG